jgi:hypothetical protein
MKKAIFLLSAGLIIAGYGFAQTQAIDPINIHRGQKGDDTTYAPLVAQSEHIQTLSAHNASVAGNPAYICVLTASRKDTVNFVNSRYRAGWSFNIISTNATNDSTLLLPASGTINGASSYWLTPAVTGTVTATYKHASFYYDGTNYWLK